MFNLLKKKINISNTISISNTSKALIVAEISANHCGNLNILKKTILKAKQSGADAVKIQSYEADTITLNVKNNHFLINDDSIWKGKYLYELYKKAQTPFKWHKEIFKFAKKNNILCFSAPFDISAVDLLESLNCPLYKVASPEIEDLQLIKKIAKTKKPIIISTGIANVENIKKAIKACIAEKNYNLILLNCISSYPAKNSELNLSYINLLKKYCPLVGYSDHSNSDLASLTSVSLGAKVIEKHFILNKKIKSPDSSFSYDPTQLSKLVLSIRRIEKMKGTSEIKPTKSEIKKRNLIHRTIIAKKNILPGQKITELNIGLMRSNNNSLGLQPKFYNRILGKKAKKNIFKYEKIKINKIIR